MQAQQIKTGSWRIKSDELLSKFLPEEGCQHHCLPEALGTGYSNSFALDQNLSYIETHYAPSKDLAVLNKIDCQEPRLIVTLALKGCSRFTQAQGNEVLFNEGYTSITAFNSSEGIRQYRGNQTVTQLRFSMGRHWLDQYFDRDQFSAYFDKKNMRVISHQPIRPEALFAAQNLIHCSTPQKLRPLFRQGQAMSILASELSHLFKKPSNESYRFNQKDKEMAHQARDILWDEFQAPPSIEALSKRIGTNQFKLKRLFHHFFNNTPYGLLLDIRMKKAYQLLESTHCSVGIAAECVGYRHASNFSAAFVQYFGIPPKQIAKRN